MLGFKRAKWGTLSRLSIKISLGNSLRRVKVLLLDLWWFWIILMFTFIFQSWLNTIYDTCDSELVTFYLKMSYLCQTDLADWASSILKRVWIYYKPCATTKAQARMHALHKHSCNFLLFTSKAFLQTIYDLPFRVAV